MLQHLLSEMKGISIRLSMIEAYKRQEINSIKNRLEDSIQRLKILSSGDSQILALMTSLKKLIAKLDLAQVARVYSCTSIPAPFYIGP